MDWLASEEGFKAAVEVEKTRKRLLATVRSGEAIEKAITEAKACHRDIKVFNWRIPSWCFGNLLRKYDEQQTREVMLQEQFQGLWLRATCDQIYHTLPRELRDMIYEIVMDETFLWPNSGGSTTDPGGIPWTLADKYEGSVCYFHQRDFVGDQVFRELMETSYRALNIPRRLMENGNMTDFLNRDKWDLGFSPLRNIRHLEVDIYEEQFRETKLHRNLSSFLNLNMGTTLNVNLIASASLAIFCWNHASWQQKGLFVEDARVSLFFEKLSSLAEILIQLQYVGTSLQVALVYSEQPRRLLKLHERGTRKDLSMGTWQSDVNALKHRFDTGELCVCGTEIYIAEEDDNTEVEEEFDSDWEDESDGEEVEENEH